MLHADLLHQFLLRIVELVHVAVDVVQVHVLVVVRLQIGHRGKFTPWLRHAGDDQMAQYLVGNLVEAYPVIDLAEQQLSAVQQHGIHVVHHAHRLLTLAPPLVLKVYRQLIAVGLQPVLGISIQL